jgi:deoxyribonuclease (pyrimidine dimer)
MTRINCIPAAELNDQMLLAEYRELPRLSALARPCSDAPRHYTLGPGHIKFFYDKGEYLRRRFEEEIVPELTKRGFKLSFIRYRPHPEGLNRDWQPRTVDQKLNRDRIRERLLAAQAKRQSKGKDLG